VKSEKKEEALPDLPDLSLWEASPEADAVKEVKSEK
jgi:hypothetical protein